MRLADQLRAITEEKVKQPSLEALHAQRLATSHAMIRRLLESPDHQLERDLFSKAHAGTRGHHVWQLTLSTWEHEGYGSAMRLNPTYMQPFIDWVEAQGLTITVEHTKVYLHW